MAIPRATAKKYPHKTLYGANRRLTAPAISSAYARVRPFFSPSFAKIAHPNIFPAMEKSANTEPIFALADVLYPSDTKYAIN